MKQANKTKERVERPLTVRPALSQAAVQFVEKHPNEVTGIVASALEAAALEARLALRRSMVSRHADSDSDSGSRKGRVLSISEAAEMLEVTRVTVYAWIESKRLLAWRATRRGVLIPAEQIMGAGDVVPGIERVLAVVGDPEAAWDFLNEESALVDPERQVRPIDALRQGKVDAVVVAAHSFLEAFT
jgi:excisionase family DNA binding protein